jgi:hypothetical protein
MGPTVQYNTFGAQFLADYGTAFNEVLILGQAISENTAAGKQSKAQYYKLKRLFVILEALDAPDLTDKEIEALEYCLINLTESTFTDTVEPVYLYQAPTVDEDFLVGTGSDGGDSIGILNYISEDSNIS